MKKSNTFITSFVTASLLLTGGAYAQSRNETALPPPGQQVSLENFDGYMDKLEGEIQDRLGQLSPGAAEKDDGGLDRPNSEPYASDLEILSKVQRDTKVLEAMLEKAQLAKQVWAEVHANPQEEYEKKLLALETQVNEARSAVAATEQRYETQLQALRTERDDALEQNALAQSRISTLERQALSGGLGSSSGLQQPKPKVASIVTNGPRSYAVFSLPDGRRVQASTGDVVFYDYIVKSIDKNSVEVHRNGNRVFLENGSYSNAGSSRPRNNVYNPDTIIIDEAANYANN